ncbi:MAG: hypothetical protein ACRD5H_00605, partial [Nitrososphaerales archaeon]
MIHNLIGSFRELETGIFQIASPYTRQYIWDDGRNVVFIDGGVAKMDGFTELGSIGVATPILGM